MNTNFKNFKTVGLIVFVISLMTFLVTPSTDAQSKQEDYWPIEGWRTATPESQGMDSQKLVEMMDLILERRYAIDSLLIIRNGYLVLEVYDYPYNKDIKHNLFSCSKSVISALVGIAIDKGYIEGVTQPLLDFFPERVADNLDVDKKDITLEHVLTMTTGLQCQDSDLYNWKGLWRMRVSDDWVKFMLDLPMSETPGTRFEYCNGATFMLSAILQKQTGMTAHAFAEKHLFSPLGITNAYWTANPNGITWGYSDLHIRPCDMAKIGYLYLKDGVWTDKRIISSQWIKASTQKYVSATLPDGYGYQWWISDPNNYSAIGYGGQLISVVKNENLVVVFTGTDYFSGSIVTGDLIKFFIIPSVKSSAPLPENPQAVEALKSFAENMSNETKLKKVEKFRLKAKMKEYINKEFGFSVKYDAQTFIEDSTMGRQIPSIIFGKRGVGKLPNLFIAAYDIPSHLALKDTGDFLVHKIKRMLPQSTNHMVYKQELIQLSDGTGANYFEINWRLSSIDAVTVGSFAFKNNKMIGVFSSGTQGTPVAYLACMVKSFRFNK